MAYFKIKFIEYWIQNCLIPPNEEASELFKGIMEIKKSIFSFTLRCKLRQNEKNWEEIKLNGLQSVDNKFNKHNNIAYI